MNNHSFVGIAVLFEALHFIEKVRVTEALMLEVSCRTAKPILTSLIENRCDSIRLLLQHPDSATDTAQRNRIRNALFEDRQLFLYTPGLDVRLYRFESTIRGRLLNKQWLNIGWFAPVAATANGREIDGRLAGHTNPMLVVASGTYEGDILISHFTSVFEMLYTDEFSIPLHQYFES